VKQALRATTEEAKAKGLFGAPSIVTGDGELFWGNDRIEQAVAWAGKAGSACQQACLEKGDGRPSF
jgi:2-hydroxychromene-2-carboxylate isomerase